MSSESLRRSPRERQGQTSGAAPVSDPPSSSGAQHALMIARLNVGPTAERPLFTSPSSTPSDMLWRGAVDGTSETQRLPAVGSASPGASPALGGSASFAPVHVDSMFGGARGTQWRDGTDAYRRAMHGGPGAIAPLAGGRALAPDASMVSGRVLDSVLDSGTHPKTTHPELWDRVSDLEMDKLIELYEQQQAGLVALSKKLEDATRRNVELSMANLQRLQFLQCSNVPILSDLTTTARMQPPLLADVATKVRSEAQALRAQGRGGATLSSDLATAVPTAALQRVSSGAALPARKTRKATSKESASQPFDASMPAMFSQEEAANILLEMQSQLTSDAARL